MRATYAGQFPVSFQLSAASLAAGYLVQYLDTVSYTHLDVYKRQGYTVYLFEIMTLRTYFLFTFELICLYYYISVTTDVFARTHNTHTQIRVGATYRPT